MMKKPIFHITILITYLLLAVLIANNSIYMHSHYLSDGRIITHAHPFKKASENVPYSSHDHSRAELMAMENLQLLFYFIFILIAYQGLVILNHFPVLDTLLNSGKYLSPHPGRSPPLF